MDGSRQVIADHYLPSETSKTILHIKQCASHWNQDI